jgi:hypothetical protein
MSYPNERQQAPLRALEQALAPLSPKTVAACLPVVMLPVYSVLTLPSAEPGKDGARLKQRSPAEVDALVAALQCVQVRKQRRSSHAAPPSF